jgi:hypothetical protein
MSIFYGTAVQFWQELISRPSGPLAFRFILQPVMASALAIRDGHRDALANRTPYLWTIIYEPTKRGPRLREGIRAVLRVILLGVAMDIAYQFIELHGLRPVQTAMIVFVLCFLPYLIVRGPAARITRMNQQRKARHQDHIHAA